MSYAAIFDEVDPAPSQGCLGGGNTYWFNISSGKVWKSNLTTNRYEDTGKSVLPFSALGANAGQISVNPIGYSGLAGKPSLGSAATQNTSAFSPAISYFNALGSIAPPTKRWIGIITPSTASGLSVDVSSAGFTSILNVQAIAVRNTSTVTSAPNVSIKSLTVSAGVVTAVVVNITEGNALTQTIVGVPVLLGLPSVFANTSGLTLYVCVDGN